MPVLRGIAAGLCLAMLALLAGCPPETPNTRPQAAFSADRTVGAPPLTVRFTDRSVPGPSPIRSWSWSFGDGTVSSDRNPVKTYTSPGNYTVRLTVLSADGQNTATREDYIQVNQITNFTQIGPAGGTVAQHGVSLTVAPGVFNELVSFAFRTQGVNFALPGEENLEIISQPVRISHSSSSPRLFASSLGNATQPASITFAFNATAVPAEDRDGTHLFILAQYEDSGRTVPIPGTVSGDTITAPILNMPASARYAVGYRPASEWVRSDIKSDDKVPTNFFWVPEAELFYSQDMLNQLTALRTGNLLNPTSFGRRNFSQGDRNTTIQRIADAIQDVYPRLAASGLRAPRVINHSGRLKLIFFNMSTSYPNNFNTVADAPFEDSFFGNLVIDPAQLLAISARNGILTTTVEGAADAGQVFSFRNAFAEGVMRAVIRGIENPRILSNDGTVSVLQGLEDASVLYIAQTLDGLSARTFGPNETIRLDEPLFAPQGTGIPGYSAAGQDFLMYVRNRYAPEGEPLRFVTESLPPNLGLLEAARLGVISAQQAQPLLPFEGALVAAADAMDTSMRANLGVSLAEAYKEFAIDLLFERSADAIIRPTIGGLPSYSYDDRFIASNAVERRAFIAPADVETFNASGLALLDNVMPLSSRVLRLEVDPLSSDVVLTFNRSAWPVDGDGNSVSVTAFQPGAPGVELGAGSNSITLSGFDPTDDCVDEVIVLISNLNLSSTVDVNVTATAVSELDLPENQVLNEYVKACNPDQRYTANSVINVPGTESLLYSLTLETGAWRGDEDVTGEVWQHQLGIIKPPVILTDTALLFITGGTVGSLPAAETAVLARLAEQSRSVVAVLATVPNQPLIFEGEDFTRVEDAILAKSFDKYLASHAAGAPDKTWPALLPMTRAAVKAMDAVQEFLASGNNSIVIRGFVVGGASKRGWTTWLTAAVDNRVRGIVPIVADVLNLDEQMAHHYSAYGFYSDALNDYVEANVFDRLGTPEGQSLLSIIDPLTYIDRLTMPKFIANSTGDQFFLPDSSRFYLGQLPGDNKIYFAPNTDHGLTSGELLRLDEGTLNSLSAWYISFVRNVPRPAFTWQFLDNNTVVIDTDRTPSSLLLWRADNTSNRDFRLQTFGPNWKSSPVTGGQNNRRWVVTVPTPAQGYTAWFVQATFPGPDPALDLPFGFSTEIRVVPDTYPETNQ